ARALDRLVGRRDARYRHRGLHGAPTRSRLGNPLEQPQAYGGAPVADVGSSSAPLRIHAGRSRVSLATGVLHDGLGSPAGSRAFDRTVQSGSSAQVLGGLAST